MSLISTIGNISETSKIFISKGQPGKKILYTREHAQVVDTSRLFFAREQLWGVLLRSKAVIELDLISSISPRACWLGQESFRI